ncbi:uncharacterized protein LOC121378234 [Gigantopelta aegis]|uniref:uncharacterized protein LOC121378234 n=1 Tax=Gigantopelta aegis TaxID=1735272 RepID=UPI001B888F0D|nr:uncharacterized protein LOC121378234 [Gigantopelta aegis]
MVGTVLTMLHISRVAALMDGKGRPVHFRTTIVTTLYVTTREPATASRIRFTAVVRLAPKEHDVKPLPRCVTVSSCAQTKADVINREELQTVLVRKIILGCRAS